MPNLRRRKFSVQNEIRTSFTTKSQNVLADSHQVNEKKPSTQNFSTINIQECKKNNCNFTSKHLPSFEIVAECDSASCDFNVETPTNIDKNVTATSRNINLNMLSDNKVTQPNNAKDIENEKTKCHQSQRQETDRMRRVDKHPHKIKVRSPKRKISVVGHNRNRNKTSISLCTADLQEHTKIVECNKDESDEAIEMNVEAEKELEEVSLEDMCRICHGGDTLSSEFGQMISACSCRGTIGRVHIKCLERWLTESGKSSCELCSTRYSTRRVHRYGVMKAFVMWFLSQNAKQLMVDGLGITLMSPLAVLAAWLSGKTLAGLMTQNNTAPWPLASTFVLACMTLVCYYCWIVSAATRHALGWWIWYRSHYEVKLQLEESEE